MLDDVRRTPAHDLGHPNPALRAEAVRSRRDMTADEMESALTDSDPEVRTAALWHLHVPITPEQLERALRDPEPGIRIRAIFRPEPSSPAQVRRALDDRDPLVAHAISVKMGRSR